MLLLLGNSRGAFAADYRVVPVKDGGTIRGMVKFATETPPRFMYSNQNDDHCPRGIPQQNLIVNQESRGIENALIVLEIHAGKAAPRMNPQLDNKDCAFSPHIQWVSKDSSLLITNSDITEHNVHAYLQDVTAFNATLPRGTAPIHRPLVVNGMYKINCDRHLWMRAWIYVSDHPYVAITDVDGRFTLTDVPAGDYYLRAWHEGWVEKGTERTGQIRFQRMEQVVRIAVHANQATEVLFDDMTPTFL